MWIIRDSSGLLRGLPHGFFGVRKGCLQGFVGMTLRIPGCAFGGNAECRDSSADDVREYFLDYFMIYLMGSWRDDYGFR